MSRKIEGMMDILGVLRFHYLFWGGRIVSHFLGMTFLLIGKPIFNILNSLTYCVLLGLIFFHATGRIPRNKKDTLLLASIFAVTWFALPVFGQVVFYLMGAVNYLWLTVAILLFLVPYRRYAENQTSIRDSWLNVLLFFFAGLIAGCGNENTVIASIAAILVMFLFKISKGKIRSIPKWFYSGLVGHIIGYLILILAPGNTVRMLIDAIDDTLYFGRVQENLTVLAEIAAANYMLPLLLLLAFYYSIRRVNRRENLGSLVYVLMGLMCFFVMIAAPAFPPRTTFGGSVFIIIGVTRALENYLRDNIGKKRISCACFVVFLALLFSLSDTALGYLNLSHESKIRDLQISESKNNNIMDVRVRPFTKYRNVHFYVKDVAADTKMLPNQQIAFYFGLNSIALE